jgi:1,4-alpha-glucan branching enzyme
MSVIAFLRKSATGGAPLLVVCNFTPMPRTNFLVGVPARGLWREILNTDARDYGGSGWGNLGAVESAPVSAHGRVESLNLTLPALSVIVLRWEKRG